MIGSYLSIGLSALIHNTLTEAKRINIKSETNKEKEKRRIKRKKERINRKKSKG